MKRQMLFGFAACALLCSAERVVSYNDKNIVLTGMIAFPAAADSRDGEVAFPALILDELLSARPLDRDDTNEESRQQAIIQLVAADQAMVLRLRALEGKRANVTCADIYSPVAGHHFADIVCEIAAVRQITTPRPRKLKN